LALKARTHSPAAQHASQRRGRSTDQYAFGDDAERKNRLRLRLTERLAHDAQRVRRLGASAIDLAWTAEGRLDACIMLGNKPWDTSAGVLIAREAGARVLDQDGAEHSQQSRSTITVTPALEADLMAAVEAALAECCSDNFGETLTIDLRRRRSAQRSIELGRLFSMCDLDDIAAPINTRPRRVLGWATSAERFWPRVRAEYVS
jgi:Inositol monophosphatase family